MIKTGDTILFQGDSITDAFRKPEEINLSFQLGSGYAFLIASRLLVERPRDGLRFLNRGVSGNTVAKVLERWDADCIALRPDLISVLAGVNDTLFGVPHSETKEAYRVLLEKTRSALPCARLVLCEPFLLPCGDIASDKIRDIAPRQLLVKTLAAEFGAVFVPLQGAFTAALQAAPAEFWAYDGIHATPAGAALIAREWRKAVGGGVCPAE
ncbi:MAG: SGNH/GDSL hydrolase family protein [Verrucomicrobiota bacterium]